ncbi:MAG: hypothetical protein L0H93_16045 [Nocardioides sp.]|nr:hypothetical protein [Nocardioides sp.]
MRVTVFHNDARDAFDRHLGYDGYQTGHPMIEVFTFDGPDSNDPAELVAENAFELFNVGDDPAFDTPAPVAVAYRAKGLRSLSVGDIVDVNGVPLACAKHGWQEVEHPRASSVRH